MNGRLLGIAFRSAVICAASAFALIALLALVLCGTADPAPLILPTAFIPLFLGAAAAGLLTVWPGEGTAIGCGLLGGGLYAVLVLLTAWFVLLNSSDNVHPDFFKLILLAVLLPASSLCGVWLAAKKQRMASSHSRRNLVKRAVRRAGMSSR